MQMFGLCWLAFIFTPIGTLGRYLPLLLGSIALNYGVSGWIIANRKGNPTRARFAFWSGVLFNVALLGAFKYTGFFIANASLNLNGKIDRTALKERL